MDYTLSFSCIYSFVHDFPSACNDILFDDPCERLRLNEMKQPKIMVLVQTVQLFPLIYLITISGFRVGGDYIFFQLKRVPGK